MAENNEAGTTVRIPVRLLDEIEGVLQTYPRPRPSRGDLLEEAWAAYRGGSAEGPGAANAPVPKRYQREVEKFIRIMQSGDVRAIKAVIANVDFFLDRLRPEGGEK